MRGNRGRPGWAGLTGREGESRIEGTMKQILIVEPDEHFAGHLFQALLSAGDFQISSAPTVRQACLIVGRQKQNLAFVPLEGLGGTIEALRRLQPDLPLVVTVARTEITVPAPYEDQIQGVLPRPAVALGLDRFLEDVWKQAVPGRPAEEKKGPGEGLVGTGNGALLPLLQGTALPETMLAILVSQGAELVAHAGTLSDEQAGRVAERVNQTWEPGLTAQIQFVVLPSRSSDLQLYTRPVGKGLLLTLVAQPETRMEAFRAQAALLARQVAGARGEKAGMDAGAVAPAETVTVEGPFPGAGAAKKYALVWRALGPLSAPLRIALRRGLERIAAENDCELHYLTVGEKLVHLVVQCPPGRSSAWAAHLFKRGAETIIQTEFAVKKELWERGYYAAERAEPLSERELDLFLNRTREG